MAIFLCKKKYICQCWYKHKVSNGQACSDNLFTVGCSKKFIGALFPLNDPMEAKSFKYPRHGWRTDIFQMLTDIFSLHSKCHVFAAANHFQYFQVIVCEKVDAAVGAFLFLDGTGDFGQVSISIEQNIGLYYTRDCFFRNMFRQWWEWLYRGKGTIELRRFLCPS